MYEYNAQILKVHDGDTVFARIDLGFRLWYETWVRLDGINAPELTTTDANGKRVLLPAGEESTLTLMNLLVRPVLPILPVTPGVFWSTSRFRGAFGVPGDYYLQPGMILNVVVQTRLGREPDTEKYGRVLGTIFSPLDPSVSINQLMLQAGQAVVD